MVNQLLQAVVNDASMREGQILIDVAAQAASDYLPWSF